MFLKKRNDAQYPEEHKKVKNAKRQIPKFLQGLIAMFLGLLLAVLCSFVIKALQPPDSSLRPDYWQKFLSDETNYKRALIQIEGSSEVYYELEEVNEEFVSLLTIERWSRQFRNPSGEEMLVFCSGGTPRWVFYSDGCVGAYARAICARKDHIYYKIPGDVADRLIDYVETKGTVREYGHFAGDTTYFDYEVLPEWAMF